MPQTGNFRTQESLGHEFRHSCLGKLIILGGIICALLVVAHFTIPDEETMMTEMTDNIRQCIEANDSIKQDWLDDAISNIGYIFTEADCIHIGIGIFGIVIPTVNFNDFLFKIGPMHKGYDQKPVRSTIIRGGYDFGSNPELGL